MLLLAASSSLAGARFDLDRYGLNAPAVRLQPVDVTFWFKNGGDEPYSGVLHARLFFSSDNSFDLTDKLLAERDQSYTTVSLGPGFETILTMAAVIPDVPPGAYHFILTLKLEPASPEAVYIVPFMVLAPDFLITEFGPLTPIAMSAPARVTWVLQNTGTAYSIGAHYQRLYHSTDPLLDGGDLFLAEVSSTNRLDKDFQARFFADFQMPAVVPRGFFIVQVDAPNNISELNEQNNTFPFPLPPQKEISISHTPNSLLISWDASYGSQNIEFSPTISPPDWQPLQAAPVLANGLYRVEIPRPATTSFYRLAAP